MPKGTTNLNKMSIFHVLYVFHKKYVPFLTNSLDYCCLAAKVPMLPGEHHFDNFSGRKHQMINYQVVRKSMKPPQAITSK